MNSILKPNKQDKGSGYNIKRDGIDTLLGSDLDLEGL